MSHINPLDRNELVDMEPLFQLVEGGMGVPPSGGQASTPGSSGTFRLLSN